MVKYYNKLCNKTSQKMPKIFGKVCLVCNNHRATPQDPDTDTCFLHFSEIIKMTKTGAIYFHIATAHFAPLALAA